MTRKTIVPPPTSREKILEAAIELMRRSGLSGAGINEIVRESGAPRGSIYYFFPNGKRQIVSEALALYGKRGVAAWDNVLSAYSNPADKIHALFRSITRRLEQGKYRQSCAAGATCLDLDEDLQMVRLAIAHAFAGWVELFTKHFPFKDTARSRSFAGLMLTVIEGAFIRARAEQTVKPFTDAADWLVEITNRELRVPK